MGWIRNGMAGCRTADTEVDERDKMSVLPAESRAARPGTPSQGPQAAVRVGVVGCGYWGPNIIRNFNFLDGCELAAVCDRDTRPAGAHQAPLPGRTGHDGFRRCARRPPN